MLALAGVVITIIQSSTLRTHPNAKESSDLLVPRNDRGGSGQQVPASGGGAGQQVPASGGGAGQQVPAPHTGADRLPSGTSEAAKEAEPQFSRTGTIEKNDQDLRSVDIDVSGFSHLVKGLVEYTYARHGRKLTIRPTSPILEARDRGEIAVVDLANECGLPFELEFPELSIKVVNNTSRTSYLSELSFQVQASVPDTTPVLAIDATNLGWDLLDGFVLVNEGWGTIPDSRMTLNFQQSQPVSVAIPPFDRGVFVDFSDDYKKQADIWNPLATYDPVLALDPFRNPKHDPILALNPSRGKPPKGFADVRLDASDLKIIQQGDAKLPKSLDGVDGDFIYRTSDHKELSYRFRTRRSHYTKTCFALDPTAEYNVLLLARKIGYVEHLAISQAIKPGDVDYFLVKIAADRSAWFKLIVSIRDVRGQSVWDGSIDLKIFVPRSQKPSSVSKVPLKVER